VLGYFQWIIPPSSDTSAFGRDTIVIKRISECGWAPDEIPAKQNAPAMKPERLRDWNVASARGAQAN